MRSKRLGILTIMALVSATCLLASGEPAIAHGTSLSENNEPLRCPSLSSTQVFGDMRDELCATVRTAVRTIDVKDKDYKESDDPAYSYSVQNGEFLEIEVAINFLIDGLLPVVSPLNPSRIPTAADLQTVLFDVLVLVGGDGNHITSLFPQHSLVVNYPDSAAYDVDLPIGILVVPGGAPAASAARSTAPGLRGPQAEGMVYERNLACLEVSTNVGGADTPEDSFYAGCWTLNMHHRNAEESDPLHNYRMIWGSGSFHGGNRWLLGRVADLNWTEHEEEIGVLHRQDIIGVAPGGSDSYAEATERSTLLELAIPLPTGSSYSLIEEIHEVPAGGYGPLSVGLGGTDDFVYDFFTFGWNAQTPEQLVGCDFGSVCHPYGMAGGWNLQYGPETGARGHLGLKLMACDTTQYECQTTP